MDHRPPPRLARLVAAAAALVAASALGLAGCSSKMEEKECTRLKIEAFDIVNKAQHCNNDTECSGSTWPACAKPLSAANAGQIKKLADGYYAGKCEEKRETCTDDTPIYCKQGLCVRKEKGAAGTTP